MTKPENSLHFRRQKIQAEVFCGQRGERSDDCGGGLKRKRPACIWSAPASTATDFRPGSGRLPVAQRFSAGIDVKRYFLAGFSRRNDPLRCLG